MLDCEHWGTEPGPPGWQGHAAAREDQPVPATEAGPPTPPAPGQPWADPHLPALWLFEAKKERIGGTVATARTNWIPLPLPPFPSASAWAVYTVNTKSFKGTLYSPHVEGLET